MKLAIFFSFLFLIAAASAEQTIVFIDSGPSFKIPYNLTLMNGEYITFLHDAARDCNRANGSFYADTRTNQIECKKRIYPTTRPLNVFLQEPEPQCEIYSAGYALRGIPTELEQVNADIVRNLTCAKLVSDYNDRMLVQAHAAMACLPPNTFVRYYNETETSCYPPQ